MLFTEAKLRAYAGNELDAPDVGALEDRMAVEPDLARRAEASGVRLITVHGRTRCQFYAGKADWAAIRAVKEAVTVPVIANGDLVSPADLAKPADSPTRNQFSPAMREAAYASF